MTLRGNPVTATHRTDTDRTTNAPHARHRARAGRPPARTPRRAFRPAIILAMTLATVWLGDAPRAADETGWFIALDAALAEPSLDRDYALQIDSTGAPVVSTLHAFDGDTDIAFRGSFGYGFGPDRGFMRVSYWSFSGDTDEAGTMPGYVNPLVFGTGYYGSFYYLYDAGGVVTTASSEVDAVIVDLEFARPLKQGRRFRANWLAGLRYAGFEEALNFTGDDGSFFTVEQEKVIDADGIGIRAGAEVEYDFGGTFALTGAFSVSLLRADTDGSAGQTIRDTGGALLASEERHASSEDSRGVILETGLQGLWRLGRVDLFLGLEASDWSGLVEDPVPAEYGRSRDSISFTSVHAGLRFWFADRRPSARP